MSVKSPLIRLAPLHFNDLPSHPSFSNSSNSTSTSTNNKIPHRPDLLQFTHNLLTQGHSLILPTTFNLTFKHHSEKPSPPTNNEVEILSTEVPSSSIQSLPWSTPSLPRSQPSKIHDEYWYARRSYHHNLSVKRNSPGTASFEEFAFGLRDRKSEREREFTPDVYDARYICDWDEELASLFAERARALPPPPPQQQSGGNDGGSSDASSFTDVRMSIYEMCHKLPGPAAPRCFPVLVTTASVSPDEFIAVTLPVDISGFEGAFYSNGRNQKEGGDHQMRKSVTVGWYVAVERVHKYVAGAGAGTGGKDAQGRKMNEGQGEDASAGAGAGAGADTAATGGKEARSHSSRTGDSNEEIEWIMATASRAKGNIPMAVQRMGVPGAIAKDVGLFLKWIRDVPDEVIKGSVSRDGNARSSVVGSTSNPVVDSGAR